MFWRDAKLFPAIPNATNIMTGTCIRHQMHVLFNANIKSFEDARSVHFSHGKILKIVSGKQTRYVCRAIFILTESNPELENIDITIGRPTVDRQKY